MKASYISAFFFFHLIFFTSTFSQDCSTCINSKFTHEYFYYQEDTFMVVNYEETYSDEYQETGSESSIILRVRGKNVDALLSLMTMEAEEVGPYYETNELKYQVDNYIYNQLHPESDEEYDEPVQEYYTHNTVFYIGAGIFSISEGHWEYGGGAHGYGHSTFGQYDAVTDKSFDWSDVFKKGTDDFVYEIVKKDMEYEGKYAGMTEEEVDEATKDSRFLSGEEYYFTSRGLEVVMQSYATLYGVFYGGYPGYQKSIPYADLKKYIIKDSPIWRLMKENE